LNLYVILDLILLFNHSEFNYRDDRAFMFVHWNFDVGIENACICRSFLFSRRL